MRRKSKFNRARSKPEKKLFKQQIKVAETTDRIIQNLKSRVEEMEDLEAIRQLKAAYCDACDDDHNGEESRSGYTNETLNDTGIDQIFRIDYSAPIENSFNQDSKYEIGLKVDSEDDQHYSTIELEAGSYLARIIEENLKARNIPEEQICFESIFKFIPMDGLVIL